jgi:hypothetical protein
LSDVDAQDFVTSGNLGYTIKGWRAIPEPKQVEHLTYMRKALFDFAANLYRLPSPEHANTDFSRQQLKDFEDALAAARSAKVAAREQAAAMENAKQQQEQKHMSKGEGKRKRGPDGDDEDEDEGEGEGEGEADAAAAGLAVLEVEIDAVGLAVVDALAAGEELAEGVAVGEAVCVAVGEADRVIVRLGEVAQMSATWRMRLLPPSATNSLSGGTKVRPCTLLNRALVPLPSA